MTLYEKLFLIRFVDAIEFIENLSNEEICVFAEKPFRPSEPCRVTVKRLKKISVADFVSLLFQIEEKVGSAQNLSAILHFCFDVDAYSAMDIRKIIADALEK